MPRCRRGVGGFGAGTGGEVGGDFFDGVGDVAEVVGAVGAEGADLVERCGGGCGLGAFVGDEFEVEAHGGEGEQEVGEDDGGVDAEAFGGGDGDFGGDVGGAADVEEGVVLADGHVLRHVAAGLAEEPDGGAVDGLAEAGTNEAAAVGPGSRIRLDYRGSIRGLGHCGHCPIWPVGVSAWVRHSILPIEWSNSASGSACARSDPGATDACF